MASAKRERKRERKAMARIQDDPIWSPTGAKKPKEPKQQGDPWRLYGLTTPIPGVTPEAILSERSPYACGP